MARGTSTGPSCLRGIIVLGMNTDGPRGGKLLVFAMAGKAERIIIVCLDQLGPAGPSMGIVAVEAEDTGIKVSAPLKVEPLLVMGFGMGLRISPESRFELVIVG